MGKKGQLALLRENKANVSNIISPPLSFLPEYWGDITAKSNSLLAIINILLTALHVVVILFNLGGNLMLWVKFDLNHFLCVNVLTFATLFT